MRVFGIVSCIVIAAAASAQQSHQLLAVDLNIREAVQVKSDLSAKTSPVLIRWRDPLLFRQRMVLPREWRYQFTDLPVALQADCGWSHDWRGRRLYRVDAVLFGFLPIPLGSARRAGM